jgi:hypothetical protein
MKILRKEFWFEAPTRRAFLNITPQVEAALRESGIKEGFCLINASHSQQFFHSGLQIHSLLLSLKTIRTRPGLFPLDVACGSWQFLPHNYRSLLIHCPVFPNQEHKGQLLTSKVGDFARKLTLPLHRLPYLQPNRRRHRPTFRPGSSLSPVHGEDLSAAVAARPEWIACSCPDNGRPDVERGFDPTVWVRCRERLIEHQQAQRVFTAIMEGLQEAGLVSRISTLECVRETLRRALLELEPSAAAFGKPAWWSTLR